MDRGDLILHRRLVSGYFLIVCVLHKNNHKVT